MNEIKYKFDPPIELRKGDTFTMTTQLGFVKEEQMLPAASSIRRDPVIYAISDMHGHLPPVIPDCDLLIVAGDVTPVWDHDLDFQRNWLKGEFTDWLLDLKDDGVTIIGIGGNHDFALEKDETLARSLPWIYLLDEEVTFQGLRIYGTPWVPNLPRWAFHKSDPSLRWRAGQIPDGLDILVTHGPPFGTADVVGDKYGGRAGLNVGDIHLRNRLMKLYSPPRMTICGHIHEQSGYYDGPWGSPLMNVAILNDRYEVTNRAERIYI